MAPSQDKTSDQSTLQDAPRAVANFRFVSNIHHAGSRYAHAETQAGAPCPVCRDFSHGLKIKHNLDDTCGVLELEQKLIGNIEVDVATKFHILI